MKNSRIIISCIAASFIVMIGCSKSPTGINDRRESPSLATSYEEASAEQIAQETAELCGVFDVSTENLGKSTTAPSSGAELSLTGQAWFYTGGWWTRNGEFSATGAQGEDCTLSGYDSAQFKDADGNTVQYPVVENAVAATLIHSGYLHIRNRLGGYVDMGRTYALNGELIRTAADTTLVLEGTLTQFFKAENAKRTAWCEYEGTAEVENVTYEKEADGWSKPVSGTINVTSPYRSIDIIFSNGTAQVTVSDKEGQVKHSSTITL